MIRGQFQGRAHLRLAPVLLLVLGSTGCLASKGDVQILQQELRAMRSDAARADTARLVQTDSAIALAARANDSLRALSTRFATFQANLNGELYDMGRQLLTVQELTGQSQRRLQELRAAFEERQEAISAGTVVPGDSTQAPAPASGPGPAQLYQIAFDQMQRGSFSAARAGFQDLLTRFPAYDDAPMAQLYIGQSFAGEQNVAAADSVYQLVVSKYPKSKAAPTALYKFGLSLLAQGKTDAARSALKRVVTEYPNSDEANLARDRLRSLK